jgi:peptidyl-prolyl cis-trans isomerase SurA
MEARENLLRFVDMMQMEFGGAARRRVLGARALVSLLVAGVGMGTAMGQQMKVPRYQSPVEAPTPQLVLPVPTSITPNGTVVEDVIVRVNDQIINRSDVERAQQQLLEDARRANATPTEITEREKDMLRDMIDQQLLISRGKELDINPDAEVIRQLDAIRKQNNLDSMEALEKAVRETGLSYEDWKANIRNTIVTQQVVRDEVGRTLRLSPKEEQAYYDVHKQEYEQPEQVRLSEILIPTPDNPTEAQIAQAQTKAEDMIAQLKAGAKFEDLAKQYSGGSTADKGGDLGPPYKRGDGKLAKVLEDQTFPLKAGEWTAPIRTRQGFVVLKVTEHTQAGVPPLKDVEEQVQEGMYHDALQPALRTYLSGLRDNAYINIQDGFVDTGSSQKQTKIVFSATTPPPLKKKVIQKQRLAPTRAVAPVATVAVAKSSSTAASSSTAGSTTATKVNVAAGKKPKKIHREKVRFGQAPQNSLPAGPEETLAAGGDQGPGATSGALPDNGAASAAAVESTNVASNDDPLAPKAPVQGKTRYSARAATEGATKAAAKVAKVKQKAADTPTPMTADEKIAQKVQTAPLGLSGDTASKKKNKKVKGAPKERLQEKAPAPAAPKPDATPIPPKSVRDNGEPVVNPAPDLSKTPPAALPGGPIDTPPPTPATPSPQPSPGNVPPQL